MENHRDVAFSANINGRKVSIVVETRLWTDSKNDMHRHVSATAYSKPYGGHWEGHQYVELENAYGLTRNSISSLLGDVVRLLTSEQFSEGQIISKATTKFLEEN